MFRNRLLVGVVIGLLSGSVLTTAAFLLFIMPAAKPKSPLLAQGSGHYDAPKEDKKKDGPKAADKDDATNAKGVPAFESLKVQVDHSDGKATVRISVNLASQPKDEHVKPVRDILDEAFKVAHVPDYKKGAPDQDGRLIIQHWEKAKPDAFVPEPRFSSIRKIGEGYKVVLSGRLDRDALVGLVERIERLTGGGPNRKAKVTRDGDERFVDFSAE
jgi:hypothetical protein